MYNPLNNNSEMVLEGCLEGKADIDILHYK